MINKTAETTAIIHKLYVCLNKFLKQMAICVKIIARQFFSVCCYKFYSYSTAFLSNTLFSRLYTSISFNIIQFMLQSVLCLQVFCKVSDFQFTKLFTFRILLSKSNGRSLTVNLRKGVIKS